MSDTREGFYWIRKSDGCKTIAEYEKSKWYLLGSEIEHDYLPATWVIIAEVANGVTTSENTLPIDSVSECYSEKDMDNAYDKGYNDGAQAAATDILG